MIVIVIVIVTNGTRKKLFRALIDIVQLYSGAPIDQTFKRNQPAFVVAIIIVGLTQRFPLGNGLDQLGLEVIQREQAVLDKGERQTKGASFPRCIKDQFTIRSRRSSGTVEVETIDERTAS